MIFKYLKRFLFLPSVILLPLSISCNIQNYDENGKFVKVFRDNDILEDLSFDFNNSFNLEYNPSFIVKNNQIYKNDKIKTLKDFINKNYSHLQNGSNLIIFSDFNHGNIESLIEKNVIKIKKAKRYVVLRQFSLMKLEDRQFDLNISVIGYVPQIYYYKVVESWYPNIFKYSFTQEDNNLNIFIKEKSSINNVDEYFKLLSDDSYKRYAFNLLRSKTDEEDKLEYIRSNPLLIEVDNKDPWPFEILEYVQIIPIDDFDESKPLNISLKNAE
ncbi:hypothetical protein [Mycoplasma leonicaptivi]|uniref:hypothetical protein n=1 Tax=Mycoplasma leonicaptivi TaxID=36742 RepID=UPI000485F839|nr:hypothetical protein [Mycoplasma leonicaptivi]